MSVSKLSIIGSDNGLSPGRRQAIIWINAGILLIGSLGTNFSGISIKIYTFSFKKMHLNMSSGKWRPFCLCLNVLRFPYIRDFTVSQNKVLRFQSIKAINSLGLMSVSKLSIIGSDNGLSPGRRQAIIWINAGILLIGSLGTNFSEISIKIYTFSFKKMHLNMSSGKWRPFCLCLNVLRFPYIRDFTVSQNKVLRFQSIKAINSLGLMSVSKLSIIGSDNGLSPGRRQAIIWINAGILLIGSLGTNFSEISIKIYTFSFKKMHLNMSSGKWRPFCLCLNVLRFPNVETSPNLESSFYWVNWKLKSTTT